MLKLPLSIVQIPAEHYSDYRYETIFKAYKWDPQVGDHNTISHHAIIITPEAAQELSLFAKQLSCEIINMEEALISRPDLYKTLGFSGKIKKHLGRISNYSRNENIRLMRFDFHPTDNGWKISEVNSDVPGGLPEASVLPQIAGKFFEGSIVGENVAQHILNSFQAKLKPGSRIAFVHATSYADDRQVMQFLADCFEQNSFQTIFTDPSHIRWENRQPYCSLSGGNDKIDGIIRFFPLEWFASLPRESDWRWYFDCNIPCCNHPVAMLAQSKRLPLVWDELNIDISAWKKLLPETREPNAIQKDQVGWIYKPAFGRVGGGISIKGTITEIERLKIEKTARRQKGLWVAQNMFNSIPIEAQGDEKFHVCLGVFTVDANTAGFYARLSKTARMDEHAQDAPVLIGRV